MSVRYLFESLAKDLGIDVPQVCLELDKYLPAKKADEIRQVETCLVYLEMIVRDILVKVARKRVRSIEDVVRAAITFGRRIGIQYGTAEVKIVREGGREIEKVTMWTYDHIANIIGAVRYILFDVIGKEAVEKALREG